MNDDETVLVTFRVRREHAAAAEAAAEREGLSRAALARRALLRHLAALQTDANRATA
jgi:hypothetical protein